MDRVKLLIIFYILIGVSISGLGFIALVMVNSGVIFQNNIYVRYLLLALTGVAILLGAHITLAGITSLRSK
ncbi:MAG: hypothetical protein N3G48_07445 [Sulfolobales archaeon]|nr:hypothetical protein [Sulfolobales archaeon]MCX8186920.1 hypothetical protein [Sulfolobales archaeon]